MGVSSARTAFIGVWTSVSVLEATQLGGQCACKLVCGREPSRRGVCRFIAALRGSGLLSEEGVSVWQGRPETDRDADARDPPPGVCSAAPLAEGRAAAARTGRGAPVRVRVRVGRGARSGEGRAGGRGAAAGPAPRSQLPGRLLCEPGTAARPPPLPHAGVIPGPRRALPRRQPTRLPARPDAASPGLPVSAPRRERT